MALSRVKLAEVEAFVFGERKQTDEGCQIATVRAVLLFDGRKNGFKVFTEALASVRKGEVEGANVLVVDVTGSESKFDDLVGDFSVGYGHVYLLPLDTLEARVKKANGEGCTC